MQGSACGEGVAFLIGLCVGKKKLRSVSNSELSEQSKDKARACERNRGSGDTEKKSSWQDVASLRGREPKRVLQNISVIYVMAA